jgi:hypothetical protein
MSNSRYPACEALDPCFEIMMKVLSKYVDGEHYFDTLADDVVFEFLYEFPGWPRQTRGRENLIALYSGYGRNIRLDRGIHCSCTTRRPLSEGCCMEEILANNAASVNWRVGF